MKKKSRSGYSVVKRTEKWSNLVFFNLIYFVYLCACKMCQNGRNNFEDIDLLPNINRYASQYVHSFTNQENVLLINSVWINE